MTPEQIERKRVQLEKRWIALDREIYDINMLVACNQGSVQFSDVPRWAEAYKEIKKVEAALDKMRRS